MAPLSSPWPLTARWTSAGLQIGGVAATELAERFGTPVLVLDVEHVRRRAAELRAAFPQVHYAVKALTSRRLVRLLVGEGLRLLAASRGELEACLRAGVPPSYIALHGNNKDDAQLERAIAAHIGLLICDNLDEIDRAEAIATRFGHRQDVLVRVIPGVSAGGHRYIATGAQDSKFGLPLERAADAVERVVDSRGLRYRGLHAHIGSQVLQTEPYLLAVDRLCELAGLLARTLGVDTEVVDVGGGLGITYREEEPPPISLLAHAIAQRLRDGAAREGIPAPQLIVEPGRAVVGGAGVTLYQVGTVKERLDGRRLVAVDGGMSDNPRPMLYGATYELAAAGVTRAAAAVPTDVVGPHCESGDTVAERVPLPTDLSAGDVVAVAGTGAYCYSLASNYNRTPRPAVVGVRNGGAELWLRGETYEDLDRLEVDLT